MVARDIETYIKSQKAEVQPSLFALYKALQAVLPQAQEKISWAMPTFYQNHNIIHFVAFKNHLGVYPGPEAIVEFKKRLSPYRTSKGAIQIPYDQELDLKLIQDIALWCLDTGHHH